MLYLSVYNSLRLHYSLTFAPGLQVHHGVGFQWMAHFEAADGRAHCLESWFLGMVIGMYRAFWSICQYDST